jgi:hypothetical protein
MLKVNRRFGVLDTCFHAVFVFGLFFDPDDGGDVSPKRQLNFNVLHGVIYQKILFFITTAVNTSKFYRFFVVLFSP